MLIAEALINARWKDVSINVFVVLDYISTKLKKIPEPPKPVVAGGETELCEKFTPGS